MSERLMQISTWYAVAKALAGKLGCGIEDIRVIDFWRSAAGLRVAYAWAYGSGPLGGNQETISLSADEADRVMWAVNS